MRETRPERALVVYAPRWRLAALSVGGAALAVVGVLASRWSRDGLDVVACYACAGLFGPAALWWLGRLVWRRPVLRVTEAGVTDSSVVGAVGFVPWRNLGEIEVRTSGRSRFLAFRAHDADDLIAALPVPRRWFARANRALYRSLINVPTVALPRHRDELIAEITTYRPESAARPA